MDAFSDRATALGGSKTTSSSGSVSVSLGIYNGDVITKSGTVGGSVSHSTGTTKGLSTLVDVNGDGLPDKVYQRSSRLYFRPQLSPWTGGGIMYGEEIQIQGISEFSKTTSTTTGYGLNTNLGYSALTAVAGEDWSKTKTQTSVYFSDVNNDGLIDIVRNGIVWFNHIEYVNGKGVPRFTAGSGDTPSPINGGGVIDDSDTQISDEEQRETIANSPLQDVIRVWVAPYAGIIKIEGNVQLQAPQGEYDEEEYAKADGVRVAIQVGGSEKWSQSIAKDNFSAITPSGVNNLPVTKWQKVYFRVQSGTVETANGSFDRVSWAPVITYTDRAEEIDPNGYSSAVFPSREGNLLSESRSLRLQQPVSFQITGHFEKPVTSDSILLQVILSNEPLKEDGSANPLYREDTVYRRVFKMEEIYSGELTASVANNTGGSNLRFSITSGSNVAWEKIKWSP
jgi:hypothetical protein